MAYFKITSDITRLGKDKCVADVEFYNDASELIRSEQGFEIDAETDEGITEALSQATKDSVAAANSSVPEITLPKNQLIEAA